MIDFIQIETNFFCVILVCNYPQREEVTLERYQESLPLCVRHQLCDGKSLSSGKKCADLIINIGRT